MATARTFELELELMRGESDARIAANAAVTAATVVAQAPKRAGMEEDDIIVCSYLPLLACTC